MERTLERLPEAQAAAEERAVTLRTWASWKRRIDDYVVWVEDGGHSTVRGSSFILLSAGRIPPAQGLGERVVELAAVHERHAPLS